MFNMEHIMQVIIKIKWYYSQQSIITILNSLYDISTQIINYSFQILYT